MQDRHKIKWVEWICNNVTNINEPPGHRKSREIVYSPGRGQNASGGYYHPQGPGAGEITSDLWTGLILVILCILGGIFYVVGGGVVWLIEYFTKD